MSRELLFVALVLFVVRPVVSQDRTFELYRAHVAAAEAYLDLDQIAEAKEHLSAAPVSHRNWEWKYLNARADVSTRTFQAHTGTIWAVAASPKGDLFATASADSTVRIWSFPDGTPVATLRGHTGQIMAIDFSPDGKRLASGAADKTVRIWDLATGETVQTLKEGLVQRVFGVRYAPDGSRLLVTSWEFNRQARRVQGFTLLYEASSGTLQRRYDITDHPEASADFLPDGHSFITGGWKSTVRRYAADSTSMQWEHTIDNDGEPTAVQWVDVSGDGTRVAVSSKDDRIRIYDATSGAVRFTSQPGTGHRDDVNAVTFSPDGSTIASASADGLVMLWNGETGRRVRTLRGHTGVLNGVAWSADGRWLVSGGADGTVKIWLLKDQLERSFSVCTSGPWSAPVNSDGSFLASASSDPGIGIWDIEGGTRRALLGDKSANAAAISIDGLRVLSGGHDGVVRYWGIENKNETFSLAGHTGGVFGVALHPTKPMGVSASVDRTVRLWDLTSGASLGILDSGSVGMYTVQFSPDGELIAAGSDGGEVKIWRASDRTRVATWKFGEQVKYLSFDRKGSMLAATGVRGGVKVWDVKKAREIRTLKGHSNSVFAIAFHPDGTRLATASYDRTVRLWDVKTGLSMLTMRGSPQEYYNAVFLKEGTELMLTTTDGTVRILRME